MCGSHPANQTCPYEYDRTFGNMDNNQKRYEVHQEPAEESLLNQQRLPTLKIKIKALRKEEYDKEAVEQARVEGKRRRTEVEDCEEDLTADQLIKKYEATWEQSLLRVDDVINFSTLGYPVRQPIILPPSLKKKDNPPPTTLHPGTPSVNLTSTKEAFSHDLLLYCLENPITVVRNLASVCDMDLGLYSSKTLTESWPEHDVEIRTQYFKNEDVNVDGTGLGSWDCYSVRDATTIKNYANYQASTYKEYLDGKKKNKGGGNSYSENSHDSSQDDIYYNPQKRFFGTQQIKFGTNVDLSDEQKWGPQMEELNKLPPPFKVFSPGNMLSHVGHQILGMNTVQLYMKVKGSRTPGHQENNNFSAVNMNIGPGDCEWFAVADEYWEDIYRLCKQNGMDYLKGSWWPDLKELEKAGIPVFRFVQRPGDLVFINIGCVHWVQSLGWCNNIAWNVGPLTALQYRMALERYEFNKLEQFQSIVPMVALSWNLARNMIIKDPELFRLIKGVLRRTLLHSLKVLRFVRNSGAKVKFHGKKEGEHTQHCVLCEEEVFNTLIVPNEGYLEVKVFCIRCALHDSPDLAKSYMCLKEYKTDELREIYDNFVLGR